MITIPKLPDVPEEQRTELVGTLLDVIRLQQEALQQLRDEIARLKGQKPKPTIKPSKLEQGLQNEQKGAGTGKRPGSLKRSKTEELQIHETKRIRPEGIPPGSRFKGYQDYVANFGACRTPIPEQIEHLFRSKSNTDSGMMANTF